MFSGQSLDIDLHTADNSYDKKPQLKPEANETNAGGFQA